MGILINIAEIFLRWTNQKIEHHLNKKTKEIFFHEKEVWWIALGQNIGYEMNGKSNNFSRPALILRKYSSGMCFVLPLTSQIKEKDTLYQYVIEIDGVKSAVNLSQGRTISNRRLINKEGKVSAVVYHEIMLSFIAFLTKNDALWGAELPALPGCQM